MKRLLLPALLLLSSPAWADILPSKDDWTETVEDTKVPEVEPQPAAAPSPPPEPASEVKGRTGCMAATSLSLTLAAVAAGWLLRDKRRIA
ncbi:MAG TPA: hypothetical protein VF815_07210 [Myxococcaceae bacterium]|jgi:hypothetical protein